MGISPETYHVELCVQWKIWLVKPVGPMRYTGNIMIHVASTGLCTVPRISDGNSFSSYNVRQGIFSIFSITYTHP